jgi:hypothetical protein
VFTPKLKLVKTKTVKTTKNRIKDKDNKLNNYGYTNNRKLYM